MVSESWRQSLVGSGAAMERVAEIVRLVANRRSTVLISGETGTGKEMVARAIHAAGSRASQLFIAINCSALPENLLEAELFGHVRGAFTGAVTGRVGRFERANRGTIFLDEIGDMPLELQAKLLRVLQERELERLGSSETVKLDVRVIAATNVDLLEACRQGRFREDLYYRLNVVPLEMPALRDRPEDIPQLAHHFIEKVCRQEGITVKEASPETLEHLQQFSWPGNVRQLENSIEMAVALSGDRAILEPSDFPLFRTQPQAVAIPLPGRGIDFEQAVAIIQLNLLQQALQRAGGNKTQAAEMLRPNRTTLTAKLKSLAAAVSA